MEIVVFFRCLQLGHRCEQEHKRFVQRWLPKNPMTPLVMESQAVIEATPVREVQ